MHAAVEGGDAPGRAGPHQAVSCQGKDGPLVLVEGLQWRVLTRSLQLESVGKQQRLSWTKKKEVKSCGILRQTARTTFCNLPNYMKAFQSPESCIVSPLFALGMQIIDSFIYCWLIALINQLIITDKPFNNVEGPV